MSTGTAADRLARILYILPAAHRAGGARLTELAACLGVDIPVVVADIEAVTAREYYHPAGSADSMCIRIEGDRVLLDGASEFERPVRLSAREALALHLALHALAAECADAERERVLALARRLTAELRVPDVLAAPAPTARPLAAPRPEPAAELEYEPETEHALLLGLGEDVLRGVLSDGIAAEQSVRLLYLKAGAAEPEPRHVAPQQLAYAEGSWYLLAYDLERRQPRIFRLDRILDAQPGTAVEDPAARDREWIARVAEQGSAFYAEAPEEQAVVRYSPAIGRWIAERASQAREADGSVVLRHPVADPRWLIRHVLQFAGDAWIEEPESLRAAVARRALELAL